MLFALAFAGAFATAAADTASSEIGQLLGRRTYLVTTFRPVPRGTEGAVSLEGTLAGIFASLVIAALGAALGLFSWKGVPVVVFAAFVGTTFESVVGAALEKRQLLDNEALNFLNTLVGALVAAAFAALGRLRSVLDPCRVQALALLAARAAVHAAAAAARHRLRRGLRLRLGAQPGPRRAAHLVGGADGRSSARSAPAS